MKERDIEKYLVRRVRELAGECRKLRWIGHNGAPDRIVMLPTRPAIWVELKAPGKKPTAAQLREHKRMRKMRQLVLVIDSFEGVDELCGR